MAAVPVQEAESDSDPDKYTSWCNVGDIESNRKRNQAIFDRSVGGETKEKLEVAAIQAQRFIEQLEYATKKRRSTLVTLRDIARELDSMKSDKDIAKVTSLSVAVEGRAIALARESFSPPRLVSPPTTESVIPKDKMKKAQGVLDEDKQAMTQVGDIYAKLKSLLEDVSQSCPQLGSSDQILCSLLVANKSSDTVSATKPRFTESICVVAITCIILTTFAKTATKQSGKIVGKVGPKIIARLAPRLADVVSKGAVETAGNVARTALRGAFQIAAPVILGFDIYELVNASTKINYGSKSAAAESLREIALGFEKQLEEMEKLLSERSALSENLEDMLRKEFDNLLEKIVSKGQVSDEDVAAVLEYMKMIARSEWHDAFVKYLSNPKAYVCAIARISQFLRPKIEEYKEEEMEKEEGIINLTFLAHGEVQRPLLPCSLYCVNDRAQSIILYVPWGCILHNSAAYGIITGNINIDEVEYTTDYSLPTRPTEWNTLPSDCTKIPETVFTRVNTSEYVYKLLMTVFALFGDKKRGLFIPYFIPPGEPSLPQVPLWALTNVVAAVGWILNKRFRIHIASCLWAIKDSILTKERHPLLPWRTVNCQQYCVVPVDHANPVTMYIPGFILPEKFKQAFDVLDTLLGTGK